MSTLLIASILVPTILTFILSLLFNRFYLTQVKKREILLKGAKGFLNTDVLLAVLRKELTGDRSFEKIMDLADKQVDDFLRIRLVKELPYVGMLIGDQTILALKKVFMKEMETLFPTVMNQYMDGMQTSFKSGTMIQDKIATIHDEQVNKLFSPVKGLIIKWFVGLGLIIGIIQALIVFLMMK